MTYEATTSHKNPAENAARELEEKILSEFPNYPVTVHVENQKLLIIFDINTDSKIRDRDMVNNIMELLQKLDYQ